jgi:hypothetical protein
LNATGCPGGGITLPGLFRRETFRGVGKG